MKTKIFHRFLLLTTLLITVCSCRDDNEASSPETSFSITIEGEDTRPVVPQTGGTITIPFTATGNWTASLMNDRADSWISLTPSSGSAGDVLLSITTTANDTYDERNATIVLRCGDDSENIVVTQKQKDALLVSSSKYEVEAKGGEINVEVQANISFEVEVKSDWIKQVDASSTRTLTTNALNFTIDINDTGEKREGEIIVKSENLSETITVYQGYGDFVALTKRDFTLPEEGGTVDIEVKSTVNYKAQILGDVDWITETETRAVSTHTRHYNVIPNESYDSREAKIVFYSLEGKTLADTVSIYQMYKGAILVARNEYQFGIQGGNLDLTVSSNLEFDVIVSDEWIQQTGIRGLIETELHFTIAENAEGKEREGTITVKDKNSDKKQVVVVKQTTTNLEREALLAFYKLTNGDGWKNNTNWCSEKPLSEWYGITTDQNGRVIRISMDRNNLIGQFPSNIGDLKQLRYLRLNDNYLYGELPESFYDLTELEYFSVINSNFGSEGGTIVIDPNNPEAPTLGRNQLSGTISEKIGNLKNLYEFSVTQNMFEGELPKAIWKLPKLKALLLTHNKNLYGEIPEDIGNLKNLVQLWLDGNNFSGKLPKAITTLSNLEELIIDYNAFTGELPKDIGNLKKLRQFTCHNNLFEGEIPESICDCLNLEWIALGNAGSVVWADGVYKLENYNHFIGGLPLNIGNLKKLEDFNANKNELTGEIPDTFYELPQIQTFDIGDNNIGGKLSDKIGNLKTMNYFRISDCSIEGNIPETVGELKELDSFCAENNNLTGNVPVGFAKLPKLETLWLNGNRLSGVLPKEIVEMELWKSHDIKAVLLDQQDGYTLSIGSDTTTDFSEDGETVILQKHTLGDGIKLVLMGDAFIDKDMEDGGNYETMMKKAMESYFSVEPFRSLRNYYDVVCIKAVSKINQIGQETAFKSRYGEGTYIEGDNDKVMEYASKALETNTIDDIQAIVILNDTKYAGTTHMYTNGFSVAYCPYVYGEDQTFGEIIHHEACGHGFGFLADEYVNGGTIPSYEITEQQNFYELYGWNANVDFTSDITRVKWNRFVTDSRYAVENIGAYEGGLTYAYGVYRPTESSIMQYNVGQFNAPSREAIYKRAMKLAYGESWTYDYESFVGFDTPSRTTTRTIGDIGKPKGFIPLASPAIHNYSAVAR